MIRIQNITKNFAARRILNEISYHFPTNERIALVGANGQGKSTLIKIIVGELEADDGQIIKPKNLSLGYLPQSFNPTPQLTILSECMAGHKTISQLQEKMTACLSKMETNYAEEDFAVYEHALKEFEKIGGYQLEGTAKKILLGLGFTEEQFEICPKTISGGWRMRLELAKILVGQHDFMVLDEPTNHLDLPTIEWLEDYLLSYKGTLLFVSHDRTFLNDLATITLSLNNGKISAYTGNFDDFLNQKEQREKTSSATLKKLSQQKEHMQSFVDRFRAKASKVGQVGSRLKMIQKLEEVMLGMPPEEVNQQIHIPKFQVSPSGRNVLTIDKVSLGYSTPLVKNLSYT
jgi:ATP-binding cassette subfamily F protein 3